MKCEKKAARTNRGEEKVLKDLGSALGSVALWANHSLSLDLSFLTDKIKINLKVLPTSTCQSSNVDGRVESRIWLLR